MNVSIFIQEIITVRRNSIHLPNEAYPVLDSKVQSFDRVMKIIYFFLHAEFCSVNLMHIRNF
jgi:cell division protein FtsL